jgi:hypothetical protein
LRRNAGSCTPDDPRFRLKHYTAARNWLVIAIEAWHVVALADAVERVENEYAATRAVLRSAHRRYSPDQIAAAIDEARDNRKADDPRSWPARGPLRVTLLPKPTARRLGSDTAPSTLQEPVYSRRALGW